VLIFSIDLVKVPSIK